MTNETHPASAHTPGPWVICEAHGIQGELCFHKIVCEATDETIASTWAGPHEANARLIASAPELLEALEACELRLTHLAQNSQDVVRELKQARAAIAKATGQMP